MKGLHIGICRMRFLQIRCDRVRADKDVTRYVN